MMGTFRQYSPQKFHPKNTQQIPVRDKNLDPCQVCLSFIGRSIVVYVCGKGWPPSPPHWRDGLLKIMARYAVRSLGKKYLHKKNSLQKFFQSPRSIFRGFQIALPLEYRTNSWPILTTFSFGCLRSKVLSVRIDWYCWWKKSCTTWNV